MLEPALYSFQDLPVSSVLLLLPLEQLEQLLVSFVGLAGGFGNVVDRIKDGADRIDQEEERDLDGRARRSRGGLAIALPAPPREGAQRSKCEDCEDLNEWIWSQRLGDRFNQI